MEDALGTEELKKEFGEGRVFDRSDLRDFYTRAGESELNENTLLSRIYALKRKGIIASVSRGKFVLGSRPAVRFLFNDAHNELRELLHNQLPHVQVVIWDLEKLCSLAGTKPEHSVVFVEADKEACEIVFDELKHKRPGVFVMPGEEIMSRYVPLFEAPVVIKPLISEAPLEHFNRTLLPSPEKLIVDIPAEPLYFKEIQGGAMHDLVKSLFTQNVINQSALKRYAKRRGMLSRLELFLKRLNLTASP